MKHMKYLLITLLSAVLMLAGCAQKPDTQIPEAVTIQLSDTQILVDGKAAPKESENAVYIANDIVYYESGKDFTYGEGTQEDAHSQQEAAAHTVVHITQPGAYRISGKLSLGQIAVDLGEDAEENPEAVVTLILDGVDITCEVAPAVIFYRVYECGNTDADKASKDVDTSAAGANVIVADGSENTVRGAYVARIYKPDSVELSEDGTQVLDAKKLHKYDGAFYSKMSMNIHGGEKNTGVLNIYAENEGLDSELHLTINGGNIHIYSGNDGINTNEDGISVTTVNGGVLTIRVTGQSGEGDGIDSNGWLVINGGTVIAAACSDSADAGIDSDMGIHINGGTVAATGHMLDRIQDGGQTYAVFTFAQKQRGADTLFLKNEAGDAMLELQAKNVFSILVYSSPELKAGSYTLWSGDQQLAGQGGMAGGGGMPGMMPGGMRPPEGEIPPGGMEPPEGMERPNGDPNQGQRPPDGNLPQNPGRPDENPGNNQELTGQFLIVDGANMFSNIQPME